MVRLAADFDLALDQWLTFCRLVVSFQFGQNYCHHHSVREAAVIEFGFFLEGWVLTVNVGSSSLSIL